MNKYVAIIGDLKKSRDIKQRDKVQARIQSALEQINFSYHALIVSKLTLTIGDEFQSLLKPQVGTLKMLDELEMKLSDYPFRLGIGYGDISTAIDRERSIGADGEAYWLAREAIGYVHDNSQGGKIRTHVSGFGQHNDRLLNTLFEVSDLMKHGWTKLQGDTFALMLRQGIYLPDFDQKGFAQKIGVSQSSLSKRLSAGNIKLYLKTRNLIGESMEVWSHDDK